MITAWLTARSTIYAEFDPSGRVAWRFRFQDSAPDTYRVISRSPPEDPTTTPFDLPQVVLELPEASTAVVMRTELPVLRRVVEDCEYEDFDRFRGRGVGDVTIERVVRLGLGGGVTSG